MEERGREYPKYWTQGEQRERISDRQRRDYVAKMKRNLEEEIYLAARCRLRYAQEALLTGNTSEAFVHTLTAFTLRNLAREARITRPSRDKGRVGH